MKKLLIKVLNYFLTLLESETPTPTTTIPETKSLLLEHRKLDTLNQAKKSLTRELKFYLNKGVIDFSGKHFDDLVADCYRVNKQIEETSKYITEHSPKP